MSPIVQPLAKLAHLTDLHMNPLKRIPQSRTETYHEDTKFEFESFAQLLKDRDIGGVVISGDFFNLKNQDAYSPNDLNYYAALFKSFGVPIYGIPGNHDLPQSSYDLVEKTAYHNLCASGAVQDISNQVILVEANGVQFQIGGMPYYPLEETFNRFPEFNARFDHPSALKIALLHLDALPTNDLPIHFEICSWTEMLDALPNVNIVCQGHIHASFPILNRQGPLGPQFVSKPWSAARIVKDYHNQQDQVLEHVHRPMFTEIAVGLNAEGVGVINLEYVEIPHYDFRHAFKPDALRKAIEDSGKISTFIQTLTTTYGSVDNAFKLQNPDDVLKATLDADPEIRQIIQDYLQEAEANG